MQIILTLYCHIVNARTTRRSSCKIFQEWQINTRSIVICHGICHHQNAVPVEDERMVTNDSVTLKKKILLSEFFERIKPGVHTYERTSSFKWNYIFIRMNRRVYLNELFGLNAWKIRTQLFEKQIYTSHKTNINFVWSRYIFLQKQIYISRGWSIYFD